MKLLITGGEGQVAYEMKRVALLHQYDFYAPSRAELSISDKDQLEHIIERYRPDFVINTAAYTKVDMAEQELDQALEANALGAKYLAIACEKYHIPLLHLSTDYVFDGKKKTPYKETDKATPLNQYGHTKLLGEQYVKENCSQAIILRVSAVFGEHGHNFIKTILRLAEEREELSIVADQITNPTSAKSIAETISVMVKHPRWGIYHYCGSPSVSWYELAKFLIEQSDRPRKLKKLLPISTAEYPTPAKRAAYSVLCCKKILKDYGIQQTDWKNEVKNVIKNLSTS